MTNLQTKPNFVFTSTGLVEFAEQVPRFSMATSPEIVIAPEEGLHFSVKLILNDSSFSSTLLIISLGMKAIPWSGKGKRHPCKIRPARH